MLRLRKLLRVNQWVKNFFVLTPLIFSEDFLSNTEIFRGTIAFIVFSLTASFIYICNDIIDKESDKMHPSKCKRPIASGQILPFTALLIGTAILVITVLIAVIYLPSKSLYFMGLYLIINFFYSLYLKKYVLIDVLIIATGFIIRVMFGGAAIEVEISPWILVTTFMVSLFLGFGKRYHEIKLDSSEAHRKSLKSYSNDLLTQLITVTNGAALVSYSIYAIDFVNISHKKLFLITIMNVTFGLFRYLYIINEGQLNGSPEEAIVKDKPFLLNILLWLTIIVVILYQ